jgi:Xaa-Pro aminopeptidase
MAEAVCVLLGKIRGVKTACIEDKVEVRLFNSLRKKLSVPLKPVSNLVESVRQIKDGLEIAAIRKTGKIAQMALEKILPRIYLGVRETALAAMLDYELRKSGAAPAFETIVAFGSNSAMPHHRPSSRRLKKIDTILIDFGAKLNGYCCDMTRCFAVGKVNKFYEKVYRTVFAAQQAALKAVKAEQSLKVVDNAAKEIIKSAKLPVYGHGTGHGLGLDIHELPTVSAFSGERGQTPFLREGNIITIEPAVYLPGRFGIRIEDDVLVTENGSRVLSSMLKNDDVPLLKIK